MRSYEKRHYILVNGIRDAIRNIDNKNYLYARNGLVILQQMLEKSSISTDEADYIVERIEGLLMKIMNG